MHNEPRFLHANGRGHNLVSRNLSIFNIADGLADGLSHFSGASRTALIYAVDPDDPIRVYDPQNLLDGHEPMLRKIYLDSGDWQKDREAVRAMNLFEPVMPQEDLDLTGLVSFGGKSAAAFYQMWFTEHHPDMCNTGPTKRWLEHATWLLSHDLATRSEFYSSASDYILREYATHAVRDFIVDELNILEGWDVRMRIYPVLDAVLNISKTMEEGAWPRGRLAFVLPHRMHQVQGLIRFPELERPSLGNYKHVRKLLLAVENSGRSLVSDGMLIVGIAEGALPRTALTADFAGGHGFVAIGEKTVCSFYDGRFHSSTRRANLVHLEEVLVESRLDSAVSNELFRTVTKIVNYAEDHKHGCTLVLDMNPDPIRISGQQLEEPLDLFTENHLDLAQSLSKVDGALHIRLDHKLHGFACILDGPAIPGEDRARGARYNSALRFTAMHENLVVIVVSSDRPVSILQSGVELTAQCYWKPVSSCMTTPPALKEWVENRM